MCHQVICLAVQLLNKEQLNEHYRLTLPTYCLVEFAETLINEMLNARKLLEENNLYEVVVKTTEVNWFYQLTNRYHHSITSYLHVTNTEIAFSGLLPPNKEPHFITSYVDINDIALPERNIKSVILNKKSVPLVLSLIRELEAKQERFEKTSDLYWQLENIVSPIRDLDDKCTNVLTTGCDELFSNLNEESNTLSVQTERLELEIEQIVLRVIKRIFGVVYGDLITHIDTKNRTTSLRFEHAYYYDKEVTFSGTGVTKQGKVGKRHQSFSIKIMADRESV
ncbi:hypothetical protein [Pseudoalteromonas tetraodonis]|uniref:hypothetical protein n=1 Tax=Pseudoalteromonas tetraodonis TaxID=43659 RepID=UPI003734FB28